MNKQINCMAEFQVGLSEKLLIRPLSSQELDCSTATGPAAFPPLPHHQDQKQFWDPVWEMQTGVEGRVNTKK